MKKSTFILLVFAFASVFVSGCNKDDDINDDNNNNNNNSIPDATFSMNVTGAETFNVNFTLPDNVASDNAVNGSQLSSQSLLTLLATTLPVTWQFGLIADVPSMATGTYDIKTGMSSYAPASQTTGYIAVSGTMAISKATLYQSVTQIEDWFIDGTFSGTYQDNSTPPNQVTIAGSFSGINIKSQ